MIESVSQSTGVLPPRLHQGDTVAVVAPAGPVRTQRLRPGLDLLAERFTVRCTEGMYTATGFLAGDDDRRVAEFNAALRDPDVRGIVLARGGYGITRILDRLDAAALRADPKPIVGFSDATALLSWALNTAGVRGVHGPVVEQLGRLPIADVKWMVDMITTAVPVGAIPGPLTALGASAGKRIQGRLLGGNLCLLSHLRGTAAALPGSEVLRGTAVLPGEVSLIDSPPSPNSEVLLIEDVGERPYAIDRYLTHLGNSGAFDNVRAVVCGDFTNCGEAINSSDPDVWSVIDERLRFYNLVGLRGLPVGHGERNLSFPFGGDCVVDAATNTIELVQPAVC